MPGFSIVFQYSLHPKIILSWKLFVGLLCTRSDRRTSRRTVPYINTPSHAGRIRINWWQKPLISVMKWLIFPRWRCIITHSTVWQCKSLPTFTQWGLDWIFAILRTILHTTTYRKIFIISRTKSQSFKCSCIRSIHWSHVLNWERICSWNSADRRCSNYIWVINNLLPTKVRLILEVLILLMSGHRASTMPLK